MIEGRNAVNEVCFCKSKVQLTPAGFPRGRNWGFRRTQRLATSGTSKPPSDASANMAAPRQAGSEHSSPNRHSEDIGLNLQPNVAPAAAGRADFRRAFLRQNTYLLTKSMSNGFHYTSDHIASRMSRGQPLEDLIEAKRGNLAGHGGIGSQPQAVGAGPRPVGHGGKVIEVHAIWQMLAEPLEIVCRGLAKNHLEVNPISEGRPLKDAVRWNGFESITASHRGQNRSGGLRQATASNIAGANGARILVEATDNEAALW